MSSSKPITLAPAGSREVMDASKATSMIADWTTQLTAHRDANANVDVDVDCLCDTIILSDKSYTSEAAALIATFLTSTEMFSPSVASGIKYAILSDIIAGRMEDEGLKVLKTITDAFQESKLVEVDLSDNALGSKGVTACETVLCGSPVAGTLERLSLQNNGLSEDTMDEVALLLTRESESESESADNSEDDKALHKEYGNACIAQNLTKIHFFNNMSGNAGCASFKKIMSRCTGNLTDIRFSGTRARAEGSAHIVSALSDLADAGKLVNITRLDLADNSFGECCEELTSALKQCPKLEYLDLHDCCLGDEGIAMVCTALLEAKSPLNFLSISGNDIGADDWNEPTRVIAALIRSVSGSLITFHASENEMKSPGIRRIVKAMKSDTIKEICLNVNECGTVGADALVDMYAAGNVPNLEKIELNGNFFLEGVVDRLTSTFGDKLEEMDDNIDDEDADDDLEPEDLEVEDDALDEEVKEQTDVTVDALVGAMGNIAM